LYLGRILFRQEQIQKKMWILDLSY